MPNGMHGDDLSSVRGSIPISIRPANYHPAVDPGPRFPACHRFRPVESNAQALQKNASNLKLDRDIRRKYPDTDRRSVEPTA